MASPSLSLAAGPSRQYNPTPDRPPSPTLKMPSPSFYSPATGAAPWANGYGSSPSATLDPAPTNAMDKSASLKRNPLVDLIETERKYVDQLGLIIRRVAGAWSRRDFPPPKLDAVFRCVETVYRANRNFGSKLKEIGPSPSSPKALGDLLMRWIDDLEPSYSKYATTFMTGFDSYSAIADNTLLPGILSEISEISPPTPPLTTWSLDALFILPYTRLRYYRKLYARLLRSTKEGRSDHKLLLVANQRLDALVSQVESRLEVDVCEVESVEGPTSASTGSREPSWTTVNERVSQASSGRESSSESAPSFSSFSSRVVDARSSAESAPTSFEQSPQRRPGVEVAKATVSQPVSAPSSATAPLTDLEKRIDPERCLDLFSMQPKKCKLQMNAPNLPFPRSLRSSHDVTIYFTPASTGKQVVHPRAHVYILSDLFLVADWMDAGEKAAKAQRVAQEEPERVGQGGPMPEMWLSYPPLAGKHLTVSEGTQSNVLSVTIMKRETFVIHAESELERDRMMKDILDCIEFASGSSSNRLVASPNPTDVWSSTHSDQNIFPPFRHPSPFSPDSSPTVSPRPSDVPHIPPPPMMGNALASQMHQLSMDPGETINWSRGTSPILPPVGNPALQGNPNVQNALPPRGASLTRRGPGNRGPSPQAAPQPLMNMPFANPSGADMSIQPGQVMPGLVPMTRSSSSRSVQSASARPMDHPPPMPAMRGPGSLPASLNGHGPPSRARSSEPLRVVIPASRPFDPPSARFSSFPDGPNRGAMPLDADDVSPPASPVEEEATFTGPAVISAQMKCKVFLKQSHQQWKSLGSGRLKLYAQAQGNVKQLVVESDSSSKNMLISTIVLTDGVERVAKTGVAVEISDRGKRTGIVYMIQLRNESAAAGLFESLLAGSDRAGR